MAQKEVTCPSGMRGMVRGLKVLEENIFADEHLQKSGEAMQKVIESCWLETLDPGPYTQTEDGRINWNNVLLGDIVYLFLELRCVTYGDNYDCNIKCTHCDKKNELTVNITELKFKSLSVEDAKIFHMGNKFEAKAPDGTKYWFKLRTSQDGKIASSKKIKQSERVTSSMLQSILAVDGVNAPRTVKDWINNLDSPDAQQIRKQIEDADCGVDTAESFVCDFCGEDNEVTLPLDQNFLKRASRGNTI